MSSIGILKCKMPQCQLCEEWCDGRPAVRPADNGINNDAKRAKNRKPKRAKARKPLVEE